MVKLFGSGGFTGLVSYGTGVLVSPDGYVLTVAGHMLDTQDLRVHLSDGRRFHAKVAVIEPELDAALVKIDKAQDLLWPETQDETRWADAADRYAEQPGMPWLPPGVSLP